MTTLTVTVPDYLAQAIKNAGDQLPLVIEMGFSRFAPLSTQAYTEALALFTENPSPQAIAQLRFSAEIEGRIEDLLERNNNAELSKAEQVELERLTQLETQLQLVKAKAFARLQN